MPKESSYIKAIPIALRLRGVIEARLAGLGGDFNHRFLHERGIVDSGSGNPSSVYGFQWSKKRSVFVLNYERDDVGGGDNDVLPLVHLVFLICNH